MPSSNATKAQTAFKGNKPGGSKVFPGLPANFVTPCSVLEAPAFGQYYVYASGPKPSSVDRPKYKGNGKTRGANDYYSMMWDPRIYRGPTYKTFKQSEKERCKKKQFEDAETKKNQRKKEFSKKNRERNLGGINRPKTPPNQSNKTGLEDMGIQTDRFLEEITDEVKEKEMTTQTDHIFDLYIPPVFCPIKLGVDNTTQIMPWELFQFDIEARPIVTTVVGKIIEQALFETMEESELESLLAQQKAFQERHRLELMRLERLHKREQKITEERQRLIAQRQKEVEVEKQTQARVTINLYSANYFSNVAHQTLSDLRREGFMTNNDGLEELFIPWLQSKSLHQMQMQDNSKALLDDILKMVVERREADVANGIWQEMSAQQNGLFPPESDISYARTPVSAYSTGYEADEDY